ncbi:MAG TPA: outer membrane protein transport protein [Polyangiaceae bacterium]|nr:outer membrane protein transport protein [Polyangiaceae bacterium]
MQRSPRLTLRRSAPALGAALAAAVLGSGATAAAAGFDTPILYTARHQAMGGTAIAYVDDPAAAFHNPAGLQGVRGLAFLGDFSLILGKVRASPGAAPQATSIESNTVVAPFFLLGAGYRLSDWLSLGFAVFPVASGGAEYKYDIGTTRSIDSTEIVFFEATPLLSLNVPKDRWLPGKLAFGAGYRASMVNFDRLQGDENDPQILNLKLTGFNFTGFRVGVQYAPIEALKLGIVYRNNVKVPTRADNATVVGQKATDGKLDFTLPSKLGFGARYDWQRLGVASDVEWAFQSENKDAPLQGTVDGSVATVPNKFEWTNGVTWRAGLEYRLGGEMQVPVRVGYLYDSRVTNKQYPSAFGTPPSKTQALTAGAGLSWQRYGNAGKPQRFQVNLAFTRRFGSTHLDKEDLGDGCPLCGHAGDYSITMTGFYLDASFDLPM